MRISNRRQLCGMQYVSATGVPVQNPFFAVSSMPSSAASPNILTIVMLASSSSPLATAAHLHDSLIVECVRSAQILRVQLERMHVTAINTNIHLQTWRTQCTIIFTFAAPPRQIFGSPADLPSNMVRQALGQQGQNRWRHLDGVRRFFVGRFFCSYSSVL